MTIAVAVLLISVLSTTGLLALWASNSQRHWFLRTAAFLAALSPLLVVPAYEPFIALSLQGTVAAGGLWLVRALSRKRREGLAEDAQAKRPWRFSLSSLLLAMVLCGGAAAVASQAPSLNRFGWQSVALVGGCGGVATLLGGWAAMRTGWRRWAGLLAALALSATIAAAPAWLDWFLISFDEFADWPPDPTSAVATYYPLERPVVEWYAVVPAVAVCVFFGIRLTVISWSEPPRRSESSMKSRRWLARSAAAAVLVVVALPAASAVVCLLTPIPIPEESYPSPNGWDDLVVAGKMLADDSGGWTSYPGLDPKPAQQTLQKQVDDAQAALVRGRLGMQREIVTRTDYLDGKLDSSMTLPQALRNYGRAIHAEGTLYAVKGQFVEAAKSYGECIEFGLRTIRGGMMIDGLIGFSSALSGAKELHALQAELDADVCRSIAQRILDAVDEVEPKELLHHRDRIWSQHARGWHGRLLLGLTDLTGDYFMDMGPEVYLYAHDRNVAALRILALQLWARALFLESGAWPQSGAELRAWANVPHERLIDPFDPQGRMLRMKAVEGGVEFYSVGENAVDDGGIAPNVENEEGVMEGGDLRLAEVFELLDRGEEQATDVDESAASSTQAAP